jgi:hypothetical protein
MQADSTPMYELLQTHKKFVASLPFNLGQSVVISGLLGAPEHNGKEALVKGFKANRERVVVEVMDNARTEGDVSGVGKQLVAIKPKNLSAA